MTREELIKAIYDNDDTWSCPEYACDMPEKEGNTGKCCLKCAEKQLKAYEDKIRTEAFDEFKQGFYEFAHYEPWSMKFEVYQEDLLSYIENLKEQNK